MTIVDAEYQAAHRKPAAKARVRVSPISFAVLAGFVGVLFTPIIINMVNAGNDYPAHVYWAYVWDQTGFVTTPLPHFLYQLVVILAQRIVPGGSYDVAAVFVGIVCYISLGLITFMLIRPQIRSASARTRTFVAMILTLITMLLGPINLLTWGSQNLTFGYLAINSYHNPTIVLLKPFALALFLCAVNGFESTTRSRAVLIGCATITFLGTIAKPNYIIALIPAVGLLVLLALMRKQTLNWPLLIIGIALPAVVVLLWQFNYVRGSNLNGFSIAPFAVMQTYSPDNLLPKFVLSILFPVVVIGLYWRQALQDTSMQLAWLTFGAGAFYTYFLVENRTYADGNFTWSGQIALFILFVASLIFLIRQNPEFLTARPISKKFALCLGILLLHVIGGIALYLPHLYTDWRTWL